MWSPMGSLDAPIVGIIASGCDRTDKATHLWVREQARGHLSQLKPSKVIGRYYSKCERWCVEEALAFKIPTQLLVPDTFKQLARDKQLIKRCTVWSPNPPDPTEAALTIVTLADVLIIVSRREHSNSYIERAKRLGCDLIWISY